MSVQLQVVFHAARRIVLPSLFIVLALSSACKKNEACESHCGPCDGEEPIAQDTLTPVRFGNDDKGVPVVEIYLEARNSCEGEGTRHWMRWQDGAVSVSEPGPSMNTLSARIEYLKDLQSEAIVWHNASLSMPFDRMLGEFHFSVIENGTLAGRFRCFRVVGGVDCGPAKK